jgi:AcrR family transcriptional regulator
MEVVCGIFTEKTFDEVSVRELVKASKISIGSFYRYFGTKDDLYIFVVDYTLNMFWERRKQLERESGRPYTIEDILEIDKNQKRFWDSFNKSSLYIRKKYYFRIDNNLLFNNFYSSVLETQTEYSYEPVKKRMMAFLLTVLQYVITEFNTLEESGIDEELYFQFFKKIAFEGFRSYKG